MDVCVCARARLPGSSRAPHPLCNSLSSSHPRFCRDPYPQGCQVTRRNSSLTSSCALSKTSLCRDPEGKSAPDLQGNPQGPRGRILSWNLPQEQRRGQPGRLFLSWPCNARGPQRDRPPQGCPPWRLFSPLPRLTALYPSRHLPVSPPPAQSSNSPASPARSPEKEEELSISPLPLHPV